MASIFDSGSIVRKSDIGNKIDVASKSTSDITSALGVNASIKSADKLKSVLSEPAIPKADKMIDSVASNLISPKLPKPAKSAGGSCLSDAVKSVVGGQVANAKGMLNNMVAGVQDTISGFTSKISAVTDTVSDIFSKIKGPKKFGNPSDLIKSSINGIAGDIKQQALAQIKSVIDIGGGILSQAQSVTSFILCKKKGQSTADLKEADEQVKKMQMNDVYTDEVALATTPATKTVTSAVGKMTNKQIRDVSVSPIAMNKFADKVTTQAKQESETALQKQVKMQKAQEEVNQNATSSGGAGSIIGAKAFKKTYVEPQDDTKYKEHAGVLLTATDVANISRETLKTKLNSLKEDVKQKYGSNTGLKPEFDLGDGEAYIVLRYETVDFTVNPVAGLPDVYGNCFMNGYYKGAGDKFEFSIIAAVELYSGLGKTRQEAARNSIEAGLNAIINRDLTKLLTNLQREANEG